MYKRGWEITTASADTSATTANTISEEENEIGVYMCCHHRSMELSKSLKYMRIQENLLFSNPDKENLWSFTPLAAKYGSVREANHTETLLHHQRATIDTGLFSTRTMRRVWKSSSRFAGRTTSTALNYTRSHTGYSDTQHHSEKRGSPRTTCRLAMGEARARRETAPRGSSANTGTRWKHRGSFSS